MNYPADFTDWALVEDVAPSLGMSVATLRDACRHLEFPHRKLPGRRRVLINRGEVAAFLNGGELVVKKLADGGRAVMVKPGRGQR